MGGPVSPMDDATAPRLPLSQSEIVDNREIVAKALADAAEMARLTIIEIAKGNGGRNAQARLAACRLILLEERIESMPDHQLRDLIDRVLAEVDRRNARARRRAEVPQLTEGE
jgi:hypothetical protein